MELYALVFWLYVAGMPDSAMVIDTNLTLDDCIDALDRAQGAHYIPANGHPVLLAHWACENSDWLEQSE